MCHVLMPIPTLLPMVVPFSYVAACVRLVHSCAFGCPVCAFMPSLSLRRCLCECVCKYCAFAHARACASASWPTLECQSAHSVSPTSYFPETYDYYRDSEPPTERKSSFNSTSREVSYWSRPSAQPSDFRLPGIRMPFTNSLDEARGRRLSAIYDSKSDPRLVDGKRGTTPLKAPWHGDDDQYRDSFRNTFGSGISPSNHSAFPTGLARGTLAGIGPSSSLYGRSNSFLQNEPSSYRGSRPPSPPHPQPYMSSLMPKMPCRNETELGYA